MNRSFEDGCLVPLLCNGEAMALSRTQQAVGVVDQTVSGRQNSYDVCSKSNTEGGSLLYLNHCFQGDCDIDLIP